MKPLRTLIKLNKQKLDELLKHITLLEKNKSALITDLENLKAQAELEMERYSGSEYAYMLDSYLKQVEKNKKRLQAQIENLSRQIIRLREELEIQFSELKKFEIALQNRLIKEHEQVKKTESKLLDEFNTTKFATDNKNNDNS